MEALGRRMARWSSKVTTRGVLISAFMQAYKFLDEKYGLKSLSERRRAKN
jgi:hypothetical protein